MMIWLFVILRYRKRWKTRIIDAENAWFVRVSIVLNNMVMTQLWKKQRLIHLLRYCFKY